MFSVYDDIFNGIYAYLLNAEGGGKNEVSYYYAYSSIFALIFLQILILAGLVMAFGGAFFTKENKILYGVLLSASLFILNWFAFIKGDRYKAFLPKYFKDKERAKLARKRAGLIMVLAFVQFVLVFIFKFIQMS